MLLHLVTLPTEWDASFGKALPILKQGNYIAQQQEFVVKRILRAAALTYVAAALADAFNLFRWAALLLRR
jgi:Zn-dependent membrane protease YugP